MFFEHLFYASIFESASKQLKELPKETTVALVAGVTIAVMHKQHTKVQIAKYAAESARHEKEAAELKLQTAKIFEVKDEDQKPTSA